VYGYPITESFQNPVTGRLTQYFQKSHFELYPENPPELRVQRSLLGEILYTPGKTLAAASQSAACRYFSETGFSVCYAFLDFFTYYGGVAQFGYPISEIEVLNGRMVQYFQRARFDWRPEMPAGERVVLADLGRLYFELRNEPISVAQPSLENLSPSTILELHSQAFSAAPVTLHEGEQVLYVIVQDQNLRPVQYAQVTAVLHFPSGKEARLLLPVTNEAGISKAAFPFSDSELGLTTIEVSSKYLHLEHETRTSFRIWH
jgi:hypothetical protein